jgi:hypothetical protein
MRELKCGADMVLQVQLTINEGGRRRQRWSSPEGHQNRDNYCRSNDSHQPSRAVSALGAPETVQQRASRRARGEEHQGRPHEHDRTSTTAEWAERLCDILRHCFSPHSSSRA